VYGSVASSANLKLAQRRPACRLLDDCDLPPDNRVAFSGLFMLNSPAWRSLVPFLETRLANEEDGILSRCG
jgi:hypothetical protein